MTPPPVKKELSYEQLYGFCEQIKKEIRKNADEFTEIIAVTRGGLTAAHILGKLLCLDVGMYSPKTNTLWTNNVIHDKSKFLVVEDLVARGRTFQQVSDFFEGNRMCRGEEWEFCPILIDADYDHTKFKYYGFRSNEWIVFPYENYDSVVAGDHGLFRDGTDQYKKD